ncbi:uncharacterized abhydrolase domain-containing protein DDB_G0269086-like [Panonychus citri]|uniref:uncharacterized abhydrolase domain-containing protein DDB_G0269086-like n=1 Tax=Panonychus citri TaxID=50023 RepID=UPI00230757A6|nr:uncharacterized abhydrolase domain-containing protein DDB_G0269086-like [Panonychus citri]
MEKKAKMTESAKSTWKGRCGAAKKAVAKKADVNKKVSSSSSTDEEETDGEPRTSKRVRSQYQPFQSPEALAVLAPALYKPPTKPCSISKNIDDKIVIFGKGDFLAVRNDEGTFYVCRTAQNVYKSSRRFKIQWLNDEKEPGIYVPDFYDQTNFECVLTNLTMDRKDKNRFKLPVEERKRTMNILERAINVEKGLTEVPDPRKVVSDGVDVSIVGKEEEQELIKISPKPSIKVAKEKPAKVNSSRSKRSSLNGLPEREASPKERRGSSETNNSKPTPSTSVKRERKSLNQTTDTATPTTEDRRHTRSSSRSFKEDIKPSPIVKPSSSSSSSSSPLIKTVTPSRKRSLRNIETPNTEEVKSGVTSPKSHSKRSNHTEVEQPESMRLVNMHTHETKRPKIRITCSDHLVDVRIKVPLDNIKTETAVNFIQKYCSQKIVTVIEKRMEYLNKNSPLPLLQSSPPQTPMTSVTSTHQERDDQEPEPKKLKTEEKDLKENDKGFGAMEVDSHEPDKPEENEKDLIEKELKDIANMQKEEKEKLEKERVEEEKAEKAERERIEEEKVEKEKKEKLEKERVEKEKLDKEKKEKERLEKEKLEKERLEKERTEKEKLEKRN